jgi:glycosyltransferase involved in cell wall biosynthesis
MPKRHEVVVLVSSFERPRHLARALASIATQEGVDGRMEVVVTDDGSVDQTPHLVVEFSRTVNFPVKFTTHPHVTFQLARCRNEGVAASNAPYLLFMDGDCVLPRDYVAIQLRCRTPGVAMAGDVVYLDEPTSAKVREDQIRAGRVCFPIAGRERRRLTRQLINNWWYRLIRHPTKPKFFGLAVAMWRCDYERVNGYDENFVGWGCEDDDLRIRLRQAGVKVRSILPWTYAYHLWHPSVPTHPKTWREGVNVGYFMRGNRPVRCLNGLVKLPCHPRELPDPDPMGAAKGGQSGILPQPALGFGRISAIDRAA